METTPRVDLRRRPRTPYLVRASIQIPGVTPAAGGWDVETRDANEWGMRITAAHAIPLLPITIRLRTPSGIDRAITGSVVHSAQIHPGTWEAGIAFSAPQPSLSVSTIDCASYGT